MYRVPDIKTSAIVLLLVNHAFARDLSDGSGHGGIGADGQEFSGFAPLREIMRSAFACPVISILIEPFFILLCDCVHLML